MNVSSAWVCASASNPTLFTSKARRSASAGRFCLWLAWGAAWAWSQTASDAQALLRAQKFHEAATAYEKLLKAAPSDPRLLFEYGMALHMSGADGKAIAPLEAALKQSPKLPPALFALGASYLRTGQPAKAIVPLARFTELVPDDIPARQMIVDAALATGQNQRAAQHLEKLSELEPARAAVWYELGRAYESFAATSFAQLEKNFPESGPFFALLAESRSQTSQRRAAFYFYRKALEKTPNLRGPRTALAAIYREEGHPEWALSEEAAEAKLGAPDCRLSKPECAFQSGDFKAAIRSAPPTALGHYWKIKSYNALARQAFERLRALPESPEAYRWAAETHASNGRGPDAIAAWREALRLSPDNPSYTRELAAALLSEKQYAEAQTLVDALLAREPKARDVQHLQGDLYLQQQLAEKAVPFLEKAGSSLPARASLARALIQAGRAAEALPHAEAVLPLDTDGSLQFQLARAYQAAGKTELAAAAMAKYQALQAKNREQQAALEEDLKIAPPR